jgi:hypothetical protein
MAPSEKAFKASGMEAGMWRSHQLGQNKIEAIHSFHDRVRRREMWFVMCVRLNR